MKFSAIVVGQYYMTLIGGQKCCVQVLEATQDGIAQGRRGKVNPNFKVQQIVVGLDAEGNDTLVAQYVIRSAARLSPVD